LKSKLRLSQKGMMKPWFIDQDFIRALEYGYATNKVSVLVLNRLVMLMTNNSFHTRSFILSQTDATGEKAVVELSEKRKSYF